MSASSLAGSIRIPSGRVARGCLRVPPSKSVSHRYFNLTLLAAAPAVIEHPLEAEDLTLFSRALEQLGFDLKRAGDVLDLTPRQGRARARGPRRGEIECGNSGTMYRFLVGSLATLEGDWILTGTPRLAQRPVDPLVQAMRGLGAKIEYLEREGFAPLRVHGRSLIGGRVEVDASESSQFLSALLMAACRARKRVELRVLHLTSSPYLELTLEAMALFGAAVERHGEDVFIVDPVDLKPPRLSVEADYSAATYPGVAALLTGGSVCLQGLKASSKQGDRRFFDLLRKIGAKVEWSEDGLCVSGKLERAPQVDLSDMPDQVPTLAAIAPFLPGTTRISNVAHLRIKESDRLAVLARELAKLGAAVVELEDGLVIEGTWSRCEPPSATVLIDPQDDHRIAMSLALVGLRRSGVVVQDAHVVDKSYPHFWRDLLTLVG